MIVPTSFQTAISVRRATLDAFDDAKRLLIEYFDVIGILLCDDDIAMRSLISDSDSGFWIAYVGSVAAGCVALRPLSAMPGAAECKRLYVRQQFRRRGVAEALISSMERDAAALGYAAIYLDSKDDLRAAIALYESAGYVSCMRYNDNPQATVFMSKNLG